MSEPKDASFHYGWSKLEKLMKATFDDKDLKDDLNSHSGKPDEMQTFLMTGLSKHKLPNLTLEEMANIAEFLNNSNLMNRDLPTMEQENGETAPTNPYWWDA
jgi:hypothetical protein